jgi:hypothetical protein
MTLLVTIIKIVVSNERKIEVAGEMFMMNLNKGMPMKGIDRIEM